MLCLAAASAVPTINPLEMIVSTGGNYHFQFTETAAASAGLPAASPLSHPEISCRPRHRELFRGDQNVRR
jgi:hypothetical protein